MKTSLAIKKLIPLILTLALCTLALTQETSWEVGDIKSGARLTVTGISSPTDGRDRVWLYMADKYLIETNLVVLDREKAVAVRDMLNLAMYRAFGEVPTEQSPWSYELEQVRGF